MFIFLLNSMQQSIGCSQISGTQNARRKMKRALKKISIVAGHLLEFERAHDEQKNKQVEKEPPGQEGREGGGKSDSLKGQMSSKRFTHGILEQMQSSSLRLMTCSSVSLQTC